MSSENYFLPKSLKAESFYEDLLTNQFIFNPLNTKLSPKKAVFGRLVRFFGCHDAEWA